MMQNIYWKSIIFIMALLHLSIHLSSLRSAARTYSARSCNASEQVQLRQFIWIW